jgi:hypothetical protein
MGTSLMMGNSERQGSKSVDKVWECDDNGLTLYDRPDGGGQQAVTVEWC